MCASRPLSSDRIPHACAGGAGVTAVSADLAALRRRIAALERRPPGLESATDGSRAERPWPLGVGALDDALPEGGLASDGLHEATPRAGAVEVPRRVRALGSG